MILIYSKDMAMLQHEFDHAGGYAFENKIRLVLTGLGFHAVDYHRPYTQFSGGQRTRAFLARLLLSDPDLLCWMNLPITWILMRWNGWKNTCASGTGQSCSFPTTAILLTRLLIMCMSSHQIWRSSVEITLLISLNAKNDTAMRCGNIEDLQEFVAKEEDYIRRNMAGQNTRQAQGRLKRLERLLDETRPLPTANPQEYSPAIT